jgi:hypothetical protein
VVVGLLVMAVGAAAFFAGRESADPPPAPALPGTYGAGREAAFTGFDGGWDYGAPYIVTLQRGGPGITYRFARRWLMRPGLEYRICDRGICSRRLLAGP